MRKVIATIALIATVLFAISQNTNQSEKSINENFALEKSRFVNDTIWFLDSTLFQRNTDSGFIDRDRSITLTHDSDGRITSQINQYMNMETHQWTNKSFDSVVFYPGSNYISEKFYSVWNTNENNWKVTIYRSYAEDGRSLLAFDKNWDNTQNQYANGYQQRWEYNESGKLIVYNWDDFESETQGFENKTMHTHFPDAYNNDTTIITSKWNPSAQTWDNFTKSDFLYGNSGLLSVRTYFNWNLSNQEWVYSLKSDFTYEDNGQLSVKTNQKWDSDASDWENDTQTTMVYNSKNLNDTTTDFFWLTDKLIWYPSYRLIRTYDENDREIEILRQDCLFPADNFVNAYRTTYIYENDNLIEERDQVWVGTDWQDDRIDLFTYVYDTLLESQTWISYDKYNHVYDTGYRFKSIYDERPLAVVFLTQSWSSEISDFVTSSQRLYYWGSLTSPDAIKEYNNFEFSVYPNPSSGVFKIELPESPGTTSSIVISDLNGRILFNDLISSKQSEIDLSRETNGIYFIQIISGNKHGVKQVIKY